MIVVTRVGRAGRAPHQPHSSPARPPTFRARCSCVSELSSVALTQRLLALCEHHGSQHLRSSSSPWAAPPVFQGCLKATTERRGALARCGPRSSIWSTWASDRPRFGELGTDLWESRFALPHPGHEPATASRRPRSKNDIGLDTASALAHLLQKTTLTSLANLQRCGVEEAAGLAAHNAERFSVDGAAATGRQWQGVSPRR